MSRPKKITELTAISFGIIIAVPIHDTPLFFQDREAQRNIYKCEEYFITERKNTDDPVGKKNFDRCRATLQWASTCGASLVVYADTSLYNTVNFSFEFDSLETMLKFNSELQARIDNFMIF